MLLRAIARPKSKKARALDVCLFPRWGQSSSGASPLVSSLPIPTAELLQDRQAGQGTHHRSAKVFAFTAFAFTEESQWVPAGAYLGR